VFLLLIKFISSFFSWWMHISWERESVCVCVYVCVLYVFNAWVGILLQKRKIFFASSFFVHFFPHGFWMPTKLKVHSHLTIHPLMHFFPERKKMKLHFAFFTHFSFLPEVLFHKCTFERWIGNRKTNSLLWHNLPVMHLIE
jgi:hypothetical protein